MTPYAEDTIVALSTPHGYGAIAIIRLSGEKSLEVLNAIFKSSHAIHPNHTIYGKVYQGRQVLDDVLVTYFKTPNSYTGENLVEINCHGSPYIVETVIDLCTRQDARLAQPGEFTKRAFLNGKLDLSQAEGINALIHSKTQAAHRTSRHLLDGRTGQQMQTLRQELIDLISLLELELDFSEEEIEFTPYVKIQQRLAQFTNNIKTLTNSYQYGRLLLDGALVPIVGAPNSGKSSLLNALLEEERVIVSPYPGTTRDAIEESFRRGGLQFRLVDTAGLRDTADTLESLGIQRTYNILSQGDLVLEVIDLTQPLNQRPPTQLPHDGTEHIYVLNKTDIATPQQIAAATRYLNPAPQAQISAKTHAGIHQLADLMVKRIKAKIPMHEERLITQKRHHLALQKAHQALQKAQSAVRNKLAAEFVITDLRWALSAMDEILGKTTNEEILNNIFNQFCIGK